MKRVALLSVVIFLNLISTGNSMAAATLTTLHIFNGTDGDAPVAALALGTNGNLYGTTEFGGTATNSNRSPCWSRAPMASYTAQLPPVRPERSSTSP